MTTSDQPSPKGVLLTTRIMWGAMLMGEIAFLVVILALKLKTQTPPEQNRLLAYVAIGMLLVMAPAAFVIRRVIFGPGLADSKVPPPKYATGIIIFMAMLEGVVFFGLVVFMLGDPLGLVAVIPAMALQLFNFPTGSAMGSDRI